MSSLRKQCNILVSYSLSKKKIKVSKCTQGLPFHMIFNGKDHWIVTSHKSIVSNGFQDILHAQDVRYTVFWM